MTTLCLLSRGLQNFGLYSFGNCMRRSKALNALFFGLGSLQEPFSTSQPRQQESSYRRVSRLPLSVARYAITHAIWRHARKDPSISFFSDHSLRLSTNALSDDQLCLICGAHSSASCLVCDEHFCSNHLYRCLDCNNQYCSRCLDDHRADGHWSDSDTAAELTRGHSAAFYLRKAAAIFILNRPLPFCRDHYCHPSDSSVVSAGCSRSRLSQPGTRSPFAALFVRILRSLRSHLALFLAGPTLELLSQSEIYLEVCR